MKLHLTSLLFLFNFFFCAQSEITAQKAPTTAGPSMQASLAADDSLMVTVILKHQQDKNLLEIRRKLESNGFWDLFPPREARVLSWQIAINLGHIIVLKLPANAVRTLNLSLENGAWGAFNTEIHLSYDYLSIYRDYIEKRQEIRKD